MVEVVTSPSEPVFSDREELTPGPPEDPGLDELTRRGYGYALFPEVAKGGLVFGGGY
jgi:hypothetical protein